MQPYFDWDPDKAASNETKHGVSFEEASTVFADQRAKEILDHQHSTTEEERWVAIGRSFSGRMLVVVHCDEGDRIRIISARVATKRERRDYEEGE